MPENDKNQQPNSPPGEDRRSALRTLKSDSTDYVRSKRLSLADLVAIKERARLKGKSLPIGTPVPFYQQSEFYFILAGLLTLILVGGLAFYLFVIRAPQPEVKIPSPPPALLTSQSEIPLAPISRQDLKYLVAQMMSSVYYPGDLIYLPIKTGAESGIKYLSSREFMALAEIKAPPELTTFLEDGFMLGILNIDKNHPVLVFEITKGKYEGGFGGMLKWENGSMLKDLDFLYMKDFSSLSPEPAFKDQLIKNNNARIAEIEPDTIMAYVILNKRFIIITDSIKSLEEMITRFVLYKLS